MTWALDLLGLGSPNWNLRATLSKFPKGWGGGCFDKGWPNAFGDPVEKVSRIITERECKLWRTQMWWGGDNHTLVPVRHLQRRLPVWEKLAVSKPKCQFYISPSCEYRHKNTRDLEERVMLIKKLAPHCIPILNPEPGSPALPGVMSEEHGKNATARENQFASWDGHSCIDGNIEQWKKANVAAGMKALWIDLFNLREAHNTLPPNQRTASPNASDYEAVIRLAGPIGKPPAPVFAGDIRPFGTPHLYKVFAEDMPGTNPRDKKPVVIIDSKVGEITAVTFNNTKVGTLKIFGSPGSYPGGLTRYYSGLPNASNWYGWQFADKCQELSGTPWGWFRAGRVFWGPVNFSFRAGFFQKFMLDVWGNAGYQDDQERSPI